MSHIVVMIAMVLLGITLAGFIFDFSESAEGISDNANDMVKQVTSSGAL